MPDRLPIKSTTAATRPAQGRRSLRHMAAIVTVVGFAAIAPTACAQAVPDRQEIHLTCVRDPQGLMCQADAPDTSVQPATTANTTTRLTPVPVTDDGTLLSPAHLDTLADVLLAFLYFVLPASIGIGLIVHDRQNVRRAMALQAQIERLEKLWRRSPQS